MPDYRLYLLDAQGRIRLALDLQCRDDQHARKVANSEARGAIKELWRGAQLVERYDDEPIAPSN